MNPQTGILQQQNLSDDPGFWEVTVRKAFSTSFPASFGVNIYAGSGIDIDIDWGDGSAPVNYTTTGVKAHSFKAPGDYKVRISGSIVNGNLRMVDNVSGWGTAEIIESAIIGGISGLTSFAYSFYGCNKLGGATVAQLPARMFDFCLKVTTFGACFYYCTSLYTVPIGLFRNNRACTDFAGTFLDCINLKVHPQIFYLTGEEASRFAGQSVNFSNCFSAENTIQPRGGTAPILWDCEGNFNGTSCFAEHSEDSLTNWPIIPSEWGGPNSPS